MPKKHLFVCILLLLAPLAGVRASRLAGFRVCRMQTASAVEKTAQFSWQIQSEQNDVRQVAYYVRVASSVEGLQGGRSQLWDSEKVMSADCQMVPYQGRRLPYASTIYWQVEVWLSNGEYLKSPVQTFRTALKYTQWKAQWIGAKPDAEPVFTHSFSIKNRPTRAILYIASIGEGECRINQKPVTDEVIGAMQADQNRSVYYTAHDVTRLINRGNNKIVISLDETTVPQPEDSLYYTEKKAMTRAQLVVETAVDTTLVLTDAAWEGAQQERTPRGLLIPLPCEGYSPTRAEQRRCTFLCDVDTLNTFLAKADTMYLGSMTENLLSDNGATDYKWLHDMEDTQTDDGRMNNGAAAVRSLYMLYRCYADKVALIKYYPMLQRWVRYAETKGDTTLTCELYDMMCEMAEAVGQTADMPVYRRAMQKLRATAQQTEPAITDTLSWMIQDLAGIRQAKGSLAYHELDMQPTFPEGMNRVSASYDSPYGTIRSQWERQDDTLLWQVSLPANTEARLHIPSGWRLLQSQQQQTHSTETTPQGTSVSIGSGSYTFRAEKTTD